MKLLVQKNMTVGDLQAAFSKVYPFLKIELFKSGIRQKLSPTALLGSSGTITEGELEIPDSMTVGQLERAFYTNFNLSVQVARMSGGIWLETTITDKWTLKQQNDQGRELSEPA